MTRRSEAFSTTMRGCSSEETGRHPQRPPAAHLAILAGGFAVGPDGRSDRLLPDSACACYRLRHGPRQLGPARGDLIDPSTLAANTRAGRGAASGHRLQSRRWCRQRPPRGLADAVTAAAGRGAALRRRYDAAISPVSVSSWPGRDMAAYGRAASAVYGGVVELAGTPTRVHISVRHTLPDSASLHSTYLPVHEQVTVKLHGDAVTAGRLSVAVGSNGWSTGAHLRFEITTPPRSIGPESDGEHKAIYLGPRPCSYCA